MKNIYKKKGFIGYYDGFSATLVGVPAFQFLYFGIYYNFKQYLVNKYPDFSNRKFGVFGIDVISSMLTGSFCQIITNPI